MSVDDTKVQAFKNALIGKFEVLSNKKNDITGDFTQDNNSFPTVQAVKSFIASAIAGKANSADLATVATSGDYDDLTNTPVISVVKQATAETGYASSYYVTVDGTQVGAKINIEKDKMLRSVSVETVGATPTSEETAAGLVTGDQYILMVVQTVDNDGTTNLILPISDMFDLQTADESTLTLSSSGVFSIKTGGVTSTQLASNAVTTAKITDANVTADKLASNAVTTAKITDGNVTTAKLDSKAVTKAKLADEVSAQWIDDADDEIEAYLDAITTALSS